MNFRDGKTLVEVLCYIVIFSFILITVTGFYFFGFEKYKSYDQIKKETMTLVDFEVTCCKIIDYANCNNDQFIVMENDNSIVLKGNATNIMYAEFIIDNGYLHTLLYLSEEDISILNLQYMIKEDYLVFYNNDNHLKIIIPKEGIL